MSALNSDDLHRIFDKLDRNRDGFVSLDELKWLLERIGIHPSLEELESLVGKSSLDFIDFWFFYDATIKRRHEEGENRGTSQEERKNDADDDKDLVNAFKVFDENGDGFISCDELQSALLKLGLWEEERGKDCCKSMIDVFDSNEDGVLDFQEFKNMMLATNTNS